MMPVPSYRSFNNYLREQFGERVFRVPIDAGFTCPNRDGVRAFGGCTFCDDRGSGAPTIAASGDIREQLERGMRRAAKRYKAKKFLAYFQAFTNTYAPEAVLKRLYDTALEYPEVGGICIGTRPDCLADNVLDMLAEYAQDTFIWLEIGLQSSFNQTLDTINRGHTAEEFFDAVERAKKRNLKVATHLIFGLPNETEEQMLTTVKKVANIGLDGIKIHQLCIYKGTPMEFDYRLGHLPTIDEDRYISLVADSLELLPKDIVIMRLVAEGSKDEVIAPAWSFEKERIMKAIDAELVRRESYQGKFFNSLQPVGSAG
ncbi:MAG: TIGR01212 family radical SAM protein [Cyanobacteria bacterium]|nr:TIGR01212 family radical SAM protein [Cyanobacteriota bacterium]